MQVKRFNSLKHGDTLVEVVMAIAIFALVAVMAVGTMNQGITNAERSLEVTMARNEIDAQAEALRYIQNNYIVEREYTESNREFYQLWENIIKNHTITATDFGRDYNMDDSGIKTCNDAFKKQVRDGATSKKGVFIINPRLIQPSSISRSSMTYKNLMKKMIISSSQTMSDGHDTNYVMRTASLYPRTIYKTLKLAELSDGADADYSGGSSDAALMENSLYRDMLSAEGIWVIGVQGEQSRMSSRGATPEFYDFYIRTCWQASTVSAPSTLTTIVRLYNPDVLE